MASFTQQSPNTTYVQGGMVDGRYSNAAFNLLAAGPPRVANIGGAAAFAQQLSGPQANSIVFPMGLMQNFNLSNTRQFNRIFEMGSERSYFVSGRTVGQISLGRMYYHGPSMLRTLYAYYQELLPPTLIPALWPNAGALSMSNPHDVKVPPGYDNIFLNLASDMFSQPIGLMYYMRDTNEDTLGGNYFEHCVVPNHGISVDATGMMLQEQAALQFERMVPVAVAGLDLITGTDSTGADTGNLGLPF